MKNVIESPHTLLEKLSHEFSKFPASTTESTMLYDHNKLMVILQEKEVISRFNCTAEDLENVYKLTRKYGIIAGNVARNKSESALQEYIEVEHIIEQELSRNLYIYAKQWGLSVKALYYYKINNFDKAFDFSIECIALNDYLIREGIHTLLFRSAEQNRNLSRVLFRSGDWMNGSLLAKDLLNYLLNGEAGTLYGSVFKDEAYWDTVPYVREGYAYECFRGMVSHMVKFESQFSGNVNLFPHMFGDLTFKVDNPDRLIIYNWIYLKTVYQADAYDEFLEAFIAFMKEPMSQLYDVLKISLFKDLNELIENSNYRDKQELLDKIKYHLDEKLNIYDNLRKNISNNSFPSGDIKIPFPGSF